MSPKESLSSRNTALRARSRTAEHPVWMLTLAEGPRKARQNCPEAHAKSLESTKAPALNSVVSAASEKARQGHVRSLETLEIGKFAERIVERQMVLLWGTPHIALQKRGKSREKAGLKAGNVGGPHFSGRDQSGSQP